MKKFTCISLLLCAVMLLQWFCVPAGAVSTETVPVESTQPTTPVSSQTAASSLPFGTVSIQNGCRTIEGMVPLGGSDRKLATAQAVFAYEVDTGTVIYSYNPDAKLSPGTLSKIVTALVAIENCELDEVVTCSVGIQSKVPGSSQKVNLKSEEQLTVEDLLHCLLLQSANDAAVALAEHVAGTRDAYVALMNARVKQMGCTSTQFGNISGLDTAVSYTTARDMAKIVVEASRNEEFARIFGTAKYTVPATNLADARNLITTNYLIDNSVIPQFLDDKVTGGLASYSEASGANIVCTASHNKMNLVCVVLGAMRTYDAEETWRVNIYGNFNEMQDLLDYIYTGFKVNRILYDGQSLIQFSVIDGESDVVGQPHVNYDTVLPIDCGMDNLYMDPKVVGQGLTAPIQQDQMIATVAIKYLNSCIAEAELYAMSDVTSLSDSEIEIRNIAAERQFNVDGVLGFIGVVGVILLGLFAAYIGLNAFRRAQRRAQRRRRRANRRRSY